MLNTVYFYFNPVWLSNKWDLFSQIWCYDVYTGVVLSRWFRDIISGSFTKNGLTLFPGWINNYFHHKVRYEITYLFPNFDGAISLHTLVGM